VGVNLALRCSLYAVGSASSSSFGQKQWADSLQMRTTLTLNLGMIFISLIALLLIQALQKALIKYKNGWKSVRESMISAVVAPKLNFQQGLSPLA
jgi:hypothetical protein